MARVTREHRRCGSSNRSAQPVPRRCRLSASAPRARAGATYWRLNGELVAGTFDRVASLWFVASCLVLQPGNNACSIMYGQKPLLRRELSNGLYHYSSFFVAKSLTSLPFQAMFAALFNTAVYFLARAPAPWIQEIRFRDGAILHRRKLLSALSGHVLPRCSTPPPTSWRAPRPCSLASEIRG